MNCTFFGHKDTPLNVKEKLKVAILDLVDNHGVKNFLVGNNGNFDSMAQRVLKEVIRSRDDVTFSIVLSRIDEKALTDNQEMTVFPEQLENVLARFAISKRNDWLIKNSDFAITFVKYTCTNAYKLMNKALKRGLFVVNIFSSNVDICK